jgi:hypothetical protein
MQNHELYARDAQLAWQAVDAANTAAEEAWEAYDAALQRARLAEDAMWAACAEAERLERAARQVRVRRLRPATVNEIGNGHR